MAYVIHYRLSFTTISGIACNFDILENDYPGGLVPLIGEGRSPVIHSWDGGEILAPIQGSKCEVNYIYERTGGVPITDFLTTDEYKFKGDFYVNGVLTFTGFMSVSDFSEPYMYAPTGVKLTFTDGLALLDNVTMTDAGYTITDGRETITSIFEAILALTELTLPFYSYFNLFPWNRTSYTDRDDDADIDAFTLSYININTFQKGEDEFDNCKSALEKILRANDCVLRQEGGAWVVIRVPEYKRFAGNIPGSGPALGASTISKTGDLIPVGRGQLKQYIAAKQRITNRYNYRIPQLLVNGKLTRLGTFIEETLSDDGLTIYRDYELSDWVNMNNEAAYIRLEFDSETNTEKDRYIYMPYIDMPQSGDWNGIYGNSIDVSAGDIIDFSFAFRSATTSDRNALFTICVLFMPSDLSRPLSLRKRFINNTNQLQWGEFVPVEVDTETNMFPSIGVGVPKDGIEKWQQFNFLYIDGTDYGIEPFPADGRIRIYVYGFNSTNGNPLPNLDFQVKDFNFQYFLHVNQSIQIEAQTNKATQVITAKNVTDNEVFLDTAPKYNIAGGLFSTNSLVLELVESYTKQTNDRQTITMVGLSVQWFEFVSFFKVGDATINQYNYVKASQITISNSTNPAFNGTYTIDIINIDNTFRSTLIVGIDEVLGLGDASFIADVTINPLRTYGHGEINALDELLMRGNWRTILEGDFYGRCKMSDYISVNSLEGHFVPTALKIDYKQNVTTGTFIEVDKASDAEFDDLTNEFKYIYKLTD